MRITGRRVNKKVLCSNYQFLLNKVALLSNSNLLLRIFEAFIVFSLS